MKLLNSCSVSVIALLLYHGTVFGQAQPEDDNHLSAELRIQSTVVDKPSNSPDSEIKNEAQTEYNAAVNGARIAEFYRFNLDYELRETRYNEGSQDNDGYWDGDASGTLSNSNGLYLINATHSRRRLITNPGGLTSIISNSESRDILTIQPIARKKVGAANTFSLAFNFADIRLERSNSNDSQRKGADFAYLRHVSPTRQLTFKISERVIDYNTSDFGDYETTSYTLRLSSLRRLFQYHIEYGVSQVSPTLDEQYSQSTLDFNLTANIGTGQLVFNATKEVSDSSQGNSNSSFFSSDVTFDNATTERTQIDRRTAGLNLRHKLGCLRCSFDFSFGIDELKGISNALSDSRQTVSSLNFNYQLSHRLSWLIDSRTTRNRFDSGLVSARPDSKSKITRTELTFHANNGFEFAATYELENASQTGQDENSTNTIGVSVAYTYN